MGDSLSHGEPELRRPEGARHLPNRAFIAVSALLFVACAAGTILFSLSGIGMIGMAMTGHQTLSEQGMGGASMTGDNSTPGTGMAMAGNDSMAMQPAEIDAAPVFLAMWIVMMVAMMLPSLVPMLWRYRAAIERAGEPRLGPPTTLAGVGYFLVWTAFGMAVFVLALAIGAIEMRHPALAHVAPVAVGVVILLAGILQFSAWKLHHLAHCRSPLERNPQLSGDARTAWRHGLSLGLHCVCSSAGFVAILAAVGVMDLRVMAIVTATITVERLVPAGERVARVVGVLAVAVGLFQIAMSVGIIR